MTRRHIPRELAGTPAFSRGRALAAGTTDWALRDRRLARITHGWYAQGAEIRDLASRCRALSMALPEWAVFSDVTAALLYSLPLPPSLGVDSPAHITIPTAATAPRRRGLVTHRRGLESHDVAVLDGVSVTAPIRTFLDLAMTLMSGDLVAVGDALLRMRLASPTELADAVSSVPRRKGLRIARAALPLLDGRAQSRPESLLRVILTGAGLALTPQCAVHDLDGRLIGHADLGCESARLAVEYEGRQHSEGAQFDYDLERYSRMAAAGWLVIRCGRRDLRDGGAALVAKVRDALRSRPAH